MKKIYYVTLLLLLSFFLWYHVIFTLDSDKAGWTGFAAFLLDAFSLIVWQTDDD